MKTILRSLILLFFIFFDNVGFAQVTAVTSGATIKDVPGVLKGKVLDAQSKEPLAGASIYVHEAKAGAASATDGHRVFKRPGARQACAHHPDPRNGGHHETRQCDCGHLH